MSRTLRFCKVNTLPGIPSEDTMYLYRDEYDRIVVAITDSTGSVIYTTHNTSSITFLIENNYLKVGSTPVETHLLFEEW